MVDEISLVVSPSFDGNPQTAQVFNSKYLKDPHAVGLKLKKVVIGEDGVLGLRYTVSSQSRKEMR